jgi:hypothetical protein
LINIFRRKEVKIDRFYPHIFVGIDPAGGGDTSKFAIVSLVYDNNDPLRQRLIVKKKIYFPPSITRINLPPTSLADFCRLLAWTPLRAGIPTTTTHACLLT